MGLARSEFLKTAWPQMTNGRGKRASHGRYNFEQHHRVGNRRRAKSIPRTKSVLFQNSGQLCAGAVRIAIFRGGAVPGEECAKEHLEYHEYRHNPDTQADPTEATKNLVAHVNVSSHRGSPITAPPERPAS